ncbi:MAG: hypothetical protein B7Z73_19150, partial [Planctomycetia bacterium 21-64-5]
MMDLRYATLWRLLRVLLRILYRFGVRGREHLPRRGPALLVANHVTFIDGVLLLAASPRPIRILAKASFVESWKVSWLCRIAGVVPMRPGPKALAETLRIAREALGKGELVCMFPEGGITRSGQLRGFKRGFLALAGQAGVPIIPVYLEGLWGSIFSFSDGKFFWKWPRRWRRPVSVWFGPPLSHVGEPEIVRRTVAELGVIALQESREHSLVLPRAMLRECRRSLRRAKLADTSGQEMTGGSLLMRSLILRRLLLRNVLAQDEKNVGLILPPSGGGVLANAALALAGRVAVNLNYTVSSTVMNSCIRQAGI